MSRKTTKQLREIEKIAIIARELSSARLAIQYDALFVFAGPPNFQSLLNSRDVSRCRPYDMGFTSGSHSPGEWLRKRVYQLKIWQRLLNDDNVRKQFRKQAKGWHQEIAELTSQAGFLASMWSDIQRGKMNCSDQLGAYFESRGFIATENGFLLTARQAGSVQRLMQTAQREQVHQLPERWLNILQTAVWISGEAAGSRLLASIAPFLPLASNLRRSEGIQRVLSFLLRINSKVKQDPELVVDLWRNEFSKWSRAVIVEARLLTPDGRHKPHQRLRKEIGKCQRLLQATPGVMPVRMVSIAAALCCCDPSSIPIPKTLFTQSKQPKSYPYTPVKKFSLRIDYLHDYSVESNYAEMLNALDACPEMMYGFEFDYVRRHLKAGMSIDDLQWFIRHDFFDSFNARDLNPAPLRELHELLETHGAQPARDLMDDICGLLEGPQDLLFYERLLKWLRGLPGFVLTKPFCKRVNRVLGFCHACQGLRDVCRTAVCCWSSPPKRLRNRIQNLTDCPAAALKPLAELAFYQKSAGQVVRIPGSLLRLLNQSRRRAHELDQLLQMESAGQLPAAAIFRLQNLRESRGRDFSPKIVRTAHVARAEAGLSALETMVRSLADRWWKKHLPNVVAPTATAHVADICAWFTSVNDAQQVSIYEILRAWSQHGADYRQYLVHNQKWILAARSRGVQLDQWLASRDKSGAFDATSFRIAVSNDPFRTFRMGSYFETCLNLRDGCNRHAVIPNAYDANKAVLYVVEPDRDVILARKLIAISTDDNLIGFHTYLNVDRATELRERIGEAVDRFCGEWARDVGLRLSDAGEPESISNEWYDDGCVEWTRAAHEGLSTPKWRVMPHLVAGHGAVAVSVV